MENKQFYEFFLECVKKDGFRNSYRTFVNNDGDEMNCLDSSIREEFTSLDDYKVFFRESIRSFLLLHDMYMFRDFAKINEDFECEVDYLLSFEPSIFTKSANYACFSIAFEKKSNARTILMDYSKLEKLLVRYPSCVQTLVASGIIKDRVDELLASEEENSEVITSSHNKLLRVNYDGYRTQLNRIIDCVSPSVELTEFYKEDKSKVKSNDLSSGTLF